LKEQAEIGAKEALKPHICCASGRSLIRISSILFIGGNMGIGMEGWTVVARALSLKRNLKKLNLGEYGLSTQKEYPV
jgi:hypothetical protein